MKSTYLQFKDSKVSYLKVVNNKKRLITTYKNDDSGKKLRAKHRIDLNTINQFVKPDEFSFAYQKGKNPKMMVKNHLQNTTFLYVDIKSFFNNININILKEKASYLSSASFTKEHLDNLIHSCTIEENKGIAIGLIPSAFLSNVYLSEFDNTLNTLLKNLDADFKYSRYSDDIIISNNKDFDYETIINEIKVQLSKLDLEIHESKTRYKKLQNYSDHIKILGLNIVQGHDGNYITVSRSFKQATKKEKNKLKKFGMNNYIYNSEL